MLLAALLTLCPSAPLASAPQEARGEGPLVELASPSARHRMTVTRIGDDDPRPARRGRYELDVLEDRGPRGLRRTWSAVVDAPQPGWTWLLADDGSAVARIDPRLAPTPRVEVWSNGRRSASLDPLELDLGAAAAHEDGTWIHPSPATLRLRAIDRELPAEGQALDLLAHDGVLRTVRAEDGDVTLSADASGTGTSVVPSVPTDVATKLDEVWVNLWSGPSEGVAGAPIELRVRGSFPTAGWRIIGFGVTVEAADAGGPLPRIVVTPWAAEPTGGAAAAQVITHFDERCALVVAEPGRYLVEVRGRAREGSAPVLRELDVRPAALLVSLVTSGGLTGATNRIEVLRDGRVRSARGTRLVPLEPYFALVDAVAALPRASHERYSKGAADLVQSELAWARDGEAYAARLDDLTLTEPYLGVVEAVLALDRDERPEPAGRPTWRIDPGQGRFVVKTTSAGLLGAFGHDHDLAVRAFEGRVLLEPGRLEAASLELVADARSLVLTGDVDEDDRAEIEAKVRDEVLEVDRHPAIAFTTSEVAAKHLGDGRWEVTLTGDLALHGRTRRQRIGATVEIADDVLRAKGKLRFDLGDFGIDPPTAAAGTVRVADRVEIVFDLVARRAP